MLYAMGFILLFTIGGLTGLFLGALATDVPLHDTYFVIAHFHYVMMGSTLFAFLAGMYHWFPKMFGKMYNENWGRIGGDHALHRLQPDVLPAVHHGRARLAAAMGDLSRGVSAVSRSCRPSARTSWRSR